MQQRRSLSVPPETELNKTFPSRFRLDDLGHYVAVALKKVFSFHYLYTSISVLFFPSLVETKVYFCFKLEAKKLRANFQDFG